MMEKLFDASLRSGFILVPFVGRHHYQSQSCCCSNVVSKGNTGSHEILRFLQSKRGGMSPLFQCRSLTQVSSEHQILFNLVNCVTSYLVVRGHPTPFIMQKCVCCLYQYQFHEPVGPITRSKLFQCVSSLYFV